MDGEMIRCLRCLKRGSIFAAAFICAYLINGGAAHAADFAASGSITLNGNISSLSGTFGPSTYDGNNGVISAGAFDFPQSTIQFGSGGDSQVTVTYQLVQTDTSSGQVASDGLAALTHATMKLHVIAAHTPAILWSVGTSCDFQPIDVVLDGTGAASGMDLVASGFTIPAVDASACGGHGSQLNAGLSGNQTSTKVHLEGDFTPPSDIIFADGFDLGRG